MQGLHDPDDKQIGTITAALQQTHLCPSMPVLPEDIICEILKHCRGLDWSYKHLAAICLVQRGAWLEHARRALYRELRVDYRHEVNRLISCLSLLPSNRSLVQHIVINGDAAHVPRIISLIQSLSSLQRVTFFDFELDLESDHQRDLCRSVARPSLGHLSLQVLPNEFMTQVLKSAGPYLYSLRIYRVALSVSKGWEEDADWNFPHLESLELEFTGNISQEVFHQLVIRNSRNLRRLQILDEGSKSWFTYDETPWQACQLDKLDYLQLRHFHTDVVQCILQQCSNNTLKHLSLTYLKKPLILDSGFQSLSTTPPSYSSKDNKGDELLYMTFLIDFPPSLEYLQIVNARTPAILNPISYLFVKRAEWLPNLKRLPRIGILAYNFGEKRRRSLKQYALQGAASRNFCILEKDQKRFFTIREMSTRVISEESD